MRLEPRHYGATGKPRNGPIPLYDRWLLCSTFALIVIGLMMVASSSVMISTKYYHHPFHFISRQMIYLGLGVVVSVAVMRIDTDFWQKQSIRMLFICLILLLLVLIPGIGRMVNGSRRWLAFGPIGIQVSELVKLCVIFFVSGYLVRQKDHLQENVFGFIKPILVLGMIAFLLLQEPDFGATVVIACTVLALLFLAGIPLRYYFGLLIVVAGSLLALALSSPYRMARLTGFLDPWADQFNSGYQLTQSLIAFGRGGWFGLGLGEGVQKLFYLPEAHTDFLLAVLAEELGLTGVMLVVVLYCILVYRGLRIAYNAFDQSRFFAAYTAYGLSFWLGFQAAVNMGVNAGLLPTKGLTLPLLSYGGASMTINCIIIALLLRIDYENRQASLGMRTLTK